MSLYIIQWFDEDVVLLAEESIKLDCWEDADIYAQGKMDEYSAESYQIN